MFNIFESIPPFVIALLIVAVFGVIVVAVILIKKYTNLFKSDEKPKSEKEIAAEELDRILQPIEEEVVEKKDEEEPQPEPEAEPEKKEEAEEPEKKDEDPANQ